MEKFLKEIETIPLFISFIGMRYFYYPYKGEIACIPEWYLCRYHPRSMFELEEIARIWLERNKKGDFGKEPDDRF